MPFVDILIFAIIAVFLILRLRSLLGSRGGFEQPQNRNPRQSKEEDGAVKGKTGRKSNVIPMSNQDLTTLTAAGLDGVRDLTPAFSDEDFINGASAVFPMVLQAYADGDLTQLKRLLGFDLFTTFSDAIRQRDEDGDVLKITIENLRSVELLDGQVVDAIASVTVQYSSIQTRDVFDDAGALMEEESVASTQMTDIWIFERDIQSADPNWKLVETQTPD